jgi:hypothetical protein
MMNEELKLISMGVNEDEERKEEATGMKGGSYTHLPLYKLHLSAMSREKQPITVGAVGQLPAAGSACAAVLTVCR